MYDITRFTLADMARCGAELREAGVDATSLEAAADAIVRYLYENLHDAKGRACVLVRLYATQAFASCRPRCVTRSRTC
jgi:two-component system NtrC family sensor kinase